MSARWRLAVRRLIGQFSAHEVGLHGVLVSAPIGGIAVAAAGSALLAADGEASQARPVAAALHARASRPRIEVLTGELVNQPGVGMWPVGGRVTRRRSGVPGYGGRVSIGQAGGGEQCPACGECDLRPYGNGSKWVCPRCHFILPCCEGGELAGLPAAGRCSGALADGTGRPSSR
jgi:hypothetical protein